MKKIMLGLCILLISFVIVGCTNTEEGGINYSSQYCNLSVVENTRNGRILQDDYTGVLYLWYKDNDLYGQTLTPLYNEDGSLKNIKDYK